MLNYKKNVENRTYYLQAQPISTPLILEKSGLTIQAHELIAGFPHSISTGNYKLMCL